MSTTQRRSSKSADSRASTPEPDEPAPANVSAVLAKVLEQLSVTSWLPSAMLIANVTILLTFQSLGGVDVAAAATRLGQQPVALFVSGIFMLVLATMITQAFERQAIMTLEGVWSTGFLVGQLRWLFVLRHVLRRQHLKTSFERVNDRAWRQVQAGLSSGELLVDPGALDPSDVMRALKAEVYGRSLEEPSPVLEVMAASIPWQQHCDPHILAKRSHLMVLILRYPIKREVMPTKLGNEVLVMYQELRIDGVQDNDFVQLHGDDIPGRIRRHHDVARGRIDMYCTLTFVFGLLTLLTPWILRLPTTVRPDKGSSYQVVSSWPSVGLMVAVYLGLTWLSYEAAIRAARFFGKSLDMARRYLQGLGRSL